MYLLGATVNQGSLDGSKEQTGYCSELALLSAALYPVPWFTSDILMHSSH